MTISRGQAISLFAFGGFLVLALWVAIDGRPSWDHALLGLAVGERSATLRESMLALAHATDALGAGIISACIAAALLRRRRVTDTLFFAAAMAGAGVLTWALKTLFQEARPTISEPLGPAAGFSFPSGHAISSIATVAAALAIASSRGNRIVITVVGGLIVLSVGASRVILGAHYPSDVLAGWAVSLAWVAAIGILAPHVRRLRRLPANT
jgi:undecaprenyl-diphosphatase